MSKMDQIQETGSMQEEENKEKSYGMMELTEDMGKMLSETKQSTDKY